MYFSANGDRGTDGKTILSGSGAPTSDLGDEGDFYLDVSGSILYGPKTFGAWGSGVSLNGTSGPSSGSDTLLFGTGIDGDVTISSGTTTLTNDMYYNNLTINGTGSINTAGYRIFVKNTLDITSAPTNAINRNGNNGVDGLGGPGVGGNALPSATIGASGNGTAGGGTSGVNLPGNQAAAPSTVSFGNGGSGGASGAGGFGNTGLNAGGAGRAGAVVSTTLSMRRTSLDLLRGVVLLAGGAGGPGGGSGAGSSTNSGRGAGGGGSGGGVVFIGANIINRGASTAVGAISATGGIAGNAQLTTALADAGAGGGGGGGGGGWVYIYYNTLSGSTATNAIDVSSGAGGAGGTQTASGTNCGGGGGSGGTAGRITLINTANNSSSEVFGTGGSAGTPASGNTGGAGGAGEIKRLSL